MSAKVLVELLLLVVGLEVGMLSEGSYSALLMLALASAVLTNPLISLLSNVLAGMPLWIKRRRVEMFDFWRESDYRLE
ncbi:hypothetical protein IRZ53_05490 [Pseudomonas fulva]|uniref:hypothetical protein n=1 Tax=Pseudomonas fulva TaxID=47880 RepID=UPI0018A8A088|nr:hypothetical protein [Pseudomonas fulva]MBF8673573.1 hypothetical protein [Pseudomonas fulva]MBF8696253.1 hypothetical protein [Pseudomonas fulva]